MTRQRFHFAWLLGVLVLATACQGRVFATEACSLADAQRLILTAMTPNKTDAVMTSPLEKLQNACGPASPQLIQALISDPDVRVRRTVISWLPSLDASRLIPLSEGTLRGILHDPDPMIRQSGMSLLMQSDTNVQGFLPEIKDALHSSSAYSRATALSVMTANPSLFNALGPDRISLLKNLLSDKDTHVRINAFALLRQLDENNVSLFSAEIKQGVLDANESIRANSISVLPMLGEQAAGLLPALKADLVSSKSFLRITAINTIPNMGFSARKLYPDMLAAVRHPDPMTRRSAIMALTRMQWGPEFMAETIFSLRKALHDNDPGVRLNAVYALGGIRTLPEEVILKDLFPLLDPDKSDANMLMTDLQAIGNVISTKRMMHGAEDLLSRLDRLLDYNDIRIRALSVSVMGAMGGVAAGEVPKLIAFLDDQNPDSYPLCAASARTLGNIGPDAKAAVPQLMRLLSSKDLYIQDSAVYGLGGIGSDARQAIPALITFVTSKNGELYQPLRLDAANALENIVSYFWGSHDLGAIPDVEKILAALQSDPALFDKQINTIRQALSALKQEQTYDTLSILKEQPWFWAVVAYLSLLFLSYLACLWLQQRNPYWIFRICRFLKIIKGSGEATFELPVVKLKVSTKILDLSYLLAFGYFQYTPAVLDAWIDKTLPKARKAFQNNDTVALHGVHVPISVQMNGKLIDKLSPAALQGIFSEDRIQLLIYGEGGSGKTSIACQIARWAMSDSRQERLCDYKMLPLFLEEADFVSEKLHETIQTRLYHLTEMQISKQWLEHLLSKKRILVVIDRFSEMAEDCRQAIAKEILKLPFHALVITSRTNEDFRIPGKTTLQPRLIDKSKVYEFIKEYLEQEAHGAMGAFSLEWLKRANDESGATPVFTVDEVLQSCQAFNQIINESGITPLLIELFIKTRLINTKMINAKLGHSQGKTPESVPELFLSYVNTLNETVTHHMNNLMIQKAAEIIAWECLQKTFRPSQADWQDTLNALAALGGDAKEIEDREAILIYLKDKLQLIALNPTGRKIHFNLDPLAEYLAAWHVVDTYQDDPELWQDLIKRIALLPEPNAVHSFLDALNACRKLRSQEEMVVEAF